MILRGGFPPSLIRTNVVLSLELSKSGDYKNTFLHEHKWNFSNKGSLSMRYRDATVPAMLE